jgi:uncharacterized protein YkwD
VIAALAVLALGAWSGTALSALSGPATPDSGQIVTTAAAPAATSQTPTSSTEAATAAAPSATNGPPAPTGAAALETEVVRLVNVERASEGCGAVTVDTRLTAAARAHSADMAANDYFSHTSRDGTEFAERITSAGYRWSSAAENIAAGQRSPASVMAAWMGSDGHRRNILNCGLRHIGVGLAYSPDDRPYWTQDFATPR